MNSQAATMSEFFADPRKDRQPEPDNPYYIQCEAPVLPTPPGKGAKKVGKNSYEVTYPVSYKYNGGYVMHGDDQWYAGFYVPEPVVPAGWKLVGIGVGLQLNARPPYATMLLVKETHDLPI